MFHGLDDELISEAGAVLEQHPQRFVVGEVGVVELRVFPYGFFLLREGLEEGAELTGIDFLTDGDDVPGGLFASDSDHV